MISELLVIQVILLKILIAESLSILRLTVLYYTSTRTDHEHYLHFQALATFWTP